MVEQQKPAVNNSNSIYLFEPECPSFFSKRTTTRGHSFLSIFPLDLERTPMFILSLSNMNNYFVEQQAIRQKEKEK